MNTIIENRLGVIYKKMMFNDGSFSEVCIGVDKNLSISGELKGKTNTFLNIVVECFDWEGELCKDLNNDICIVIEDGQKLFLQPVEGRVTFDFQSPIEGGFEIIAYIPECDCSRDVIKVVITNE